MPECVEFDMRQFVPVKELPELRCYRIRGYKRTYGVDTNKVRIRLCFTRHNVLTSLQLLQVVAQRIVHCEAADAAVCFEHSLQYYLALTSTAYLTDNLVGAQRQYA